MYGLVVDQVTNLVESGPQLLEGLAARANELPEQFRQPVAEFLANQADQLPSRVNDVAAIVGRQAVGFGTTLIGTVVSGLAVLLLTFYLVADGPRLRWQLSRRLAPTRQKELLRVWELAIAKTGGYVYSRVLLAVVSAAVHIVAFQFAGLPYATPWESGWAWSPASSRSSACTSPGSCRSWSRWPIPRTPASWSWSS